MTGRVCAVLRTCTGLQTGAIGPWLLNCGPTVLLVTAAGFETGRIGVAFKLRLWVAYKLPTPPRPDYPPYPKTMGGGVVV